MASKCSLLGINALRPKAEYIEDSNEHFEAIK